MRKGTPLPGWHYKNIDTLGMDIPGRVHELISHMGWFALYGLMRAEALRSTRLALDEIMAPMSFC